MKPIHIINIILGLIIIVLQIIIVKISPKNYPVTTLVPLRPSMTRETDALVINQPKKNEAQRDLMLLQKRIEEIKNEEYVFTEEEKSQITEALYKMIVLQKEEEGILDKVQSFRKSSIEASWGILSQLDANQREIILKNRQDLYNKYETIYWNELAEKLSKDSAR